MAKNIINNPSKSKTNVDKLVNMDIESLSDRITGLETAINKIVNKLNTPAEVKSEFKAPDAIPSAYQSSGYVPPKYRQICDEILSSEFGFDTEEQVGSMDFTIKIIIPERYSSLTAQEKAANVQDIRSKVISRALGENGVRDWCIKVRENLNKFYTSSGVVSPFTKA